jgi:leucine dehydrogenase
MGEFIDKLGGKYIAAKDMNITSEDLIQVQQRTRHVLGITGVPGSSGDPSPMTAHGLFRALEATVEHQTGKRSLSGLKVAVQGLGHVGYRYAEIIREAGAQLWVTDLNDAVVQKAKTELGATPVPMDAIYDQKVDVFSPCARGAVLNSKTIPRLHCRAVCGAANNQLATEEDGQRLHDRGILYAPDYAVNSGGIINIFIEYAHRGYDEAKALAKTDEIYPTMKEIFRRSQSQKLPPSEVADQLAEERLSGK